MEIKVLGRRRDSADGNMWRARPYQLANSADSFQDLVAFAGSPCPHGRG